MELVTVLCSDVSTIDRLANFTAQPSLATERETQSKTHQNTFGNEMTDLSTTVPIQRARVNVGVVVVALLLFLLSLAAGSVVQRARLLVRPID